MTEQGGGSMTDQVDPINSSEVRVRAHRLLLTISLLLLASGASAAEVTRTLRAELTGADVTRFGVENLAGFMRVTGGSED